MADLAMTPAVLAEMVSLIEGGTISGKIAKQILPDLLTVSLFAPEKYLNIHEVPVLALHIATLGGNLPNH